MHELLVHEQAFLIADIQGDRNLPRSLSLVEQLIHNAAASFQFFIRLSIY